MNQNDARKIDTHLTCQSASEASPAWPESRENWEQEQYACYYNYLFSLIKNANLHYEEVGKRSGLNGQHIEEVLTFRLKPVRQNTQLIGHRAGSCYICKSKNQNSSPVEPVCLKCLKSIEIACLEIEEDAALLTASSKPASSPLSDERIVSEVTGDLEPTEANSSMVPIALLQAAQTELAYYKAYFGNLPPEAQLEVASAVLQAQSQEAQQKEVTLDRGLSPSIAPPAAANDEPINETEQLLQILAVNDQDLASETADLTHLLKTLLPENNAPLRHFGFQRSKSYKLP
jgi:hypothetical protein